MFFGQSSFADYALATERNVVKVRQDAPLELLGPLVYGIQTGAGAVLNSLMAEAGSSMAIFGAGSVGLSAVMAARVAGCTTIIAVDLDPGRLQIARELGATHAISGAETSDVVEAIQDVSGGGVEYALDTTSNPAVFRQAVDSLKMLGTCGLIGGMAPGTEVHIEANHLLPGRTVRGIIQGDSIPQVFIPRLIELYMQGRFPFDRLIRFYELEEINQARADMGARESIKPVLRVA
jgi:aryl-alcohol dehydrogenase